MKKQPGILHYILKVYTVVCPSNHQKLAWLKDDIFLINFYFTFWTFNLKRHGATIVFIFVPPHLFEIFKLKITKNKAKPRIGGGYILWIVSTAKSSVYEVKHCHIFAETIWNFLLFPFKTEYNSVGMYIIFVSKWQNQNWNEPVRISCRWPYRRAMSWTRHT